MIKEHQVESCDNGNRDSQADNQRRPQTAIRDHLKTIAGQRLLNNRQPADHTIDNLHRIETHFLVNRQSDTALAIDADNIFRTIILEADSSDFT